MKSLIRSAISVSMVFAAVVSVAGSAEAVRKFFDIPQQELSVALQKFAMTANLEILFAPELVTGKNAAGVRGEMPVYDALERLLQGTGLQYSLTDSEKVVVLSRTAAVTATAEPSSIVLAQNTGSPAGGGEIATAAEEPPVQQAAELEEVVVTGTHIRGTRDTGPGVIVLDRDFIDRSGFGNVSQLMQSLPQNFGGGPSPDMNPNVPRGGADANGVYGAGINLRGLGTGATLTLLNGHRIAPAGAGSFSDISLIPLSAIERVEILLDGASAIYGSDAIGGVVNIITRKEFPGAESRVRLGSVTEGSRQEYQLAQLLGTDWDSGRWLVNYEFNKEEALPGTERDFAENVRQPYDVLNAQKSHSLYSSLRQELGPRLTLSGDLLYLNREYDARLTTAFAAPERAFGEAAGTNLALGLTADVANSWRAEVFGTYSRNLSDLRSQPLDGSTPAIDSEDEYDVWALEARADGALAQLPAGAMKLALGAGYRQEDYTAGSFDPLQPVSFRGDRTVSSAYAEVFVPLVGEANRRAGVAELNLTLAGRYDDYSDFGDTTNPRFGVVWSPLDGVRLQGTYSTSFRAPRFSDLNTAGAIFGYIFDVSDPQSTRPDGLSTALILDGGNPDLHEETSTSWTWGIAIAPPSLEALKVKVNYFDIEYKDRIERLVNNLGTFLLQEAALAEFVNRAPSDALVSDTIASVPGGVSDFNQFVFGRTDIDQILLDYDFGAFFDARFNNVAVSEVRGLDFAVGYDIGSERSRWQLGLNASYLLDFQRRVSESAPIQELLDTVFNPIDWRARARAAWLHGHWSVTSAVNYTDDYTDPFTTPFTDGAGSVRVESSTTLDFQIAFNTLDAASFSVLDNTVVSLDVLNAFDSGPPRIQAAPFNLAYDAENGDPLGRFVALQVVKRWGSRAGR